MEQTNKKNADIGDFEQYCNLYNIVGDEKAIEFLRAIVEEVHQDNYFAPGTKRPSILIVGKEGKTLLANAFLNTLAIEDVRICPSKHFDNGMNSKELFDNSLYDTAIIITDFEQLRQMSEATIWRYLRYGWCSYPNFPNRNRDYIHSNGFIILTASSLDKVGKPIQKAIKYIVRMEPYNQRKLFAICHQYLKIFCGIEYQDEDVLQSICEYGNGEISRIYELLKLIMLTVKTDNIDAVSANVVEKALGMRG